MLRVIAVFALFLLFWPSVSIGSDDIVGYRTPDNWWVLGDDIEEVDLDDFAELPETDYGWNTYIDLRRVIQFDSTDRVVTCTLMFKRDKLAAIFISVPAEEMAFRALHRYYKQRIGGCTVLLNELDGKSWVDEDGDFLMLVRSEDGDFGECTVVVYLTESAMEYFAGVSIPEWMWDVLATYET